MELGTLRVGIIYLYYFIFSIMEIMLKGRKLEASIEYEKETTSESTWRINKTPVPLLTL